MSFPTGYRPDPEVVRQRRAKFHHFKAARGLGIASLPLSTSNRQFLAVARGGPGILDQGQTSSCEGHAHASGFTLGMAVRGTPIPLVSPIGLYQMAVIQGLPPAANGELPSSLPDEGTEPSLVIQAAQTWGIASAKTWGKYPADQATIVVPPDAAELIAASACKLNGAYFMTSERDQYCLDFMTALASKILLTGAIAASSAEFQSYRGGVLGPLDDNVDHATLWIDYEWDGTNLSSLKAWGCNSWGWQQWGTSDVPTIAGGLYQSNRDFLVKYSQETAALDVTATGSEA